MLHQLHLPARVGCLWTMTEAAVASLAREYATYRKRSIPVPALMLPTVSSEQILDGSCSASSCDRAE